MKGEMSGFSGFEVSSKPETSLGRGFSRQAVFVGASLLAFLFTLCRPAAAQQAGYSTRAAVAGGFVPIDPSGCPLYSNQQERGGDGEPFSAVGLIHDNPCGGGLDADATSDLLFNNIQVGMRTYPPFFAALADATGISDDSIYFANVTEPFTLYLDVEYQGYKNHAHGRLQINDIVDIPLMDTSLEWVRHRFAVLVFPEAPVVELNITASVASDDPGTPASGGWQVRMSQMIVPEGITCTGTFSAGWIQQTCDQIGRVP